MKIHLKTFVTPDIIGISEASVKVTAQSIHNVEADDVSPVKGEIQHSRKPSSITCDDYQRPLVL